MGYNQNISGYVGDAVWFNVWKCNDLELHSCIMTQERSCILLRFADLLEKHKDDLAAIETWDNGKPYKQAAEVEVPSIIRLMRYYAGKLNEISPICFPSGLTF